MGAGGESKIIFSDEKSWNERPDTVPILDRWAVPAEVQ